jgi:tetratricopeptide (TPR) repeat protein
VTSAERGNLPAASADAAALLAEARTLRASGEFREAAEAYRRLESAYPESAEAHASLVSLGDLLVAQLADPAGGLKAFDAYLASGGVLAEEAAFGRIGALRALGREGEEREAVVSFLARYPGTLHDDALRARLRALGGSR